MKGVSNFFIKKYLKNIKYFVDVIPFNHISKKIFKDKKRCFLIINTDYCSEKGKHWFVVEKYKKTYFLFDSLGEINKIYKKKSY